MTQGPGYQFTVVEGVGSATMGGAQTINDAVRIARAEAARSGAPTFVRRAGEVILSVLPTGVVAVDIHLANDVDDDRPPLPHGARWPDRHPLTGERFEAFSSAGGAAKVDFIFETRSGRHLRGDWHGFANLGRGLAGWTWDVEEMLAEDLDPLHLAEE